MDQVPATLFDRARTQLAGSPPGTRQAPTVRRTREMFSPHTFGGEPQNDEHRPGSIATSLTPREWDQLVDIIVERLEDRVSDELSRRGRRFHPGVM
ncbi:hypothetical protein [Nakamurella sp. PAMC28650]|uniref:hypothetical protein n=1 Tax=Nakamurella sp. PAMC28650 TaxID=2762325 RepID=UPI00164E0438|nr:hypothetical protein [Nakamurella sp. PAMC28650]QNK81327.1 hypothetical protein H7F38_00140 [Nakamurella sp. PAMC28650]